MGSLGGDPTQLAHLDAVVESSTDAIISNTLDGTICLWNGAAARLFGRAASDAIGQSITLIVPPDLQAEERALFKKLLDGDRVDQIETVGLRADGQHIPIRLSVCPIRDPRGDIIGASRIIWDCLSAGAWKNTGRRDIARSKPRMAEFMGLPCTRAA